MRHVNVKLVISGTAALAGMIAGCGGGAPSSSTGTTGASEVARSGGVVESHANCQATIDALLSAPISPPNLFLNLDLSRRTSEDGGLGTGGITIDQSELEACAQWVEALVPPAGPSYPGMRGVALASTYTGRSKTEAAGDPISVEYNVESRVLGQVVLSGPSYTGTLAFQSRKGGAYGKHSYVVGMTPEAGSTVAGYVTRDGADFAADWTTSAWINEMYDGILATFAPDQPAASTGDCRTSLYTSDTLGTNTTGASCLFLPDDGIGNSYLGVRPLSFYLMFAAGTNHTETVYEDWRGGLPSCATPASAIERMDWAPITYGAIGTSGIIYGPTIGGLQANGDYSNPTGMFFSEAESVEGCGGVAVASADPGYSALQWGPHGEVEMEYNAATGVAYKVIAKPGYAGSWSFNAQDADGGVGSLYVVTPDSITLAGAAVTIDWSSLESATADVTAISNAWLSYELGIPADTDCRASHDCKVTIDDGQGHSSFTVKPANRYWGENVPGFTVVFGQGSSTPVAIETVNPAGE